MFSPSGRSKPTPEDAPLLQAGAPAPCPAHNDTSPSCPIHSPSSKASIVPPKSSDTQEVSISEETPLLQAGSSVDPPSYDGTSPTCPIHSSPPPSPPSSSYLLRKWSCIIALVLLCIVVIGVLSVGLFAPTAAGLYAKEAVISEVSSLSVESFTDRGMRARVQIKVVVDATRVRSNAIRNLGRVGTWLVRKVSIKESVVRVYLPDYGSDLLGTATAPAIVIDIRNGHSTLIDFVSEVETVSLDVVRRVTNDYLNGELMLVRVRGEADLALKSGLLGLGTQRIYEEMAFEEIPPLPNFQVNRLSFGEAVFPHQKALSANASITIGNPLPLDLEIPSLSFIVLLPGCEAHELVLVATAQASHLSIKPKTDINLNISAVVRNLPDDFTNACPKSDTSPMDNFLGGYLHGNATTVYVRGTNTPNSNAPRWLLQFLQSVTLPVPFPAHTLDNVIKSFSLSNVKFRLPPPGAEPDSPESSPRLSATVGAVIRLPEEITFPLDVKRLRAMADVSYKGEKFGTLNLQKWIPANSSRSDDKKYLQVYAMIDDAPLNVTDYDVFEKVVAKIIFGSGKSLLLGIVGDTDVDIKTSLGEFVVSKIPTVGNITIDAFPDIRTLPPPHASEVIIVDTTQQSITLQIALNINNPTPWEVVIPYINVNVKHNNMILGNATLSNTHIFPGNNTIHVSAVWDPLTHGGAKAEKIGSQFVGEYVSGHNTTLTIRPHVESLPPLPLLSRVLAEFEVTIPTPKIHDLDDDTTSRFIESGTMHIFTSTADFIIRNPLVDNQITVKKVNGTARYNGSDLGTILYEWPFDIKSGNKGKSLTPRLPVDWSLDSVGYKAMRKAFGGQLKVHAEALCLVEIGKFDMELLYDSNNPIRAYVRF